MKKGLNYWSFPGGLSGEMKIEEAARVTREAGFDGIELALSAKGELTPETPDREVEKLRKTVVDQDIEIASLASVLTWDYPLTSDDPDTRKKSIKIVKRGLETASILQTDAFLVIPGAVDIFFNPNEPVVAYDVAYSRLREALDELVPFAEKAGVSIALENVWNRFLLSPLEVRDLVDAYSSNRLGVYFDTANVMSTGYPQQWISILGKRIHRVHFKDFSRAVGTADGFVDLLEGDVDWPAVMSALNAIGYDGFCTAELIPLYNHAPNVRWENASRAMDAILSGAISGE